MKKLDDKKINELIKIAENDDYLFSLLYISYSNGLKVHSCSTGDKRKNINPNISYIIETTNFDKYRNIIATIEDIPNIIVSTSYDVNIKEKLLTITCFKYNKDEVFFNIASSFEINNYIETKKAISFYKSLYQLICLNKKEVEYLVYDGIKISSSFNTLTKDMIKYQKNSNNIIYKLLYSELDSTNKYDKEPMYKIKELKK